MNQKECLYMPVPQRNYANKQTSLLGVSGCGVSKGPGPGHLRAHRPAWLFYFPRLHSDQGPGGRENHMVQAGLGGPQNRQALPLKPNLIKRRAGMFIECLHRARLLVTVGPPNPETLR